MRLNLAKPWPMSAVWQLRSTARIKWAGEPQRLNVGAEVRRGAHRDRGLSGEELQGAGSMCVRAATLPPSSSLFFLFFSLLLCSYLFLPLLHSSSLFFSLFVSFLFLLFFFFLSSLSLSLRLPVSLCLPLSPSVSLCLPLSPSVSLCLPLSLSLFLSLLSFSPLFLSSLSLLSFSPLSLSFFLSSLSFSLSLSLSPSPWGRIVPNALAMRFVSGRWILGGDLESLQFLCVLCACGDLLSIMRKLTSKPRGKSWRSLTCSHWWPHAKRRHQRMLDKEMECWQSLWNLCVRHCNAEATEVVQNGSWKSLLVKYMCNKWPVIHTQLSIPLEMHGSALWKSCRPAWTKWCKLCKAWAAPSPCSYRVFLQNLLVIFNCFSRSPASGGPSRAASEIPRNVRRALEAMVFFCHSAPGSPRIRMAQTSCHSSGVSRICHSLILGLTSLASLSALCKFHSSWQSCGPRW